MTWTRLSDDYTDDCWRLSDEAFRLHTEALIWSNRKLLDCTIPKDDVRRFAKRPEAIPELLAAGWWTETKTHYVIRHHAVYQRQAAAVLRQQAANRENPRGHGRPRKAIGPSREQWPENDSFNDSFNDLSDERVWSGPGLEEEDKRESFTDEQTNLGASSQLQLCRHGIPGGDQPDDWSSGRLTCPECAS